ncbi:hypothetical protein QG37_04607 [Candidozyma auris]|nr:hypothetical protein QG37_04607 [[Candida] auris]
MALWFEVFVKLIPFQWSPMTSQPFHPVELTFTLNSFMLKDNSFYITMLF